MLKEIGGYFELELSNRHYFPHSEGTCLNSGRNALEYVLRSIPAISRIWLPYYTCEVVLEPLKKMEIPYSFYAINDCLELKELIDLKPDEYLLVTNYFGIKDSYIRQLSQIYGAQLIVDNAQAYYCDPIAGIKTVYSPRKFVGVPDGGIAFVSNGCDVEQFEIDCSYNRCSHLLKRYDLGASGGYTDFRDNSHELVNQPIRRMSHLTAALLSNIDFVSIRQRRIENFNYLHQVLGASNLLGISDVEEFACPMVYPYYTDNVSLKKKLIENKVFVATYWPNVMRWCKPTDVEYKLADRILALPIDQRYTTKDMQQIVKNTCEFE